MFIQKGKGDEPARPRGRPRGATEQGAATRDRLYAVAVDLFARDGYDETTLRDIAGKAGVSVGLLYRYFPSKRAVVVALYDQLSADYAARAAVLADGPWRERFVHAVRASLAVLGKHRAVLAALLPVLVSAGGDGVLAPTTEFSRRRVEAVFVAAVTGASDAPAGDDATALGQVLYVAHLAVVLWWLLDRSPRQRATKELVAKLEGVLPMASMLLGTGPFLRAASALIRAALLGNDAD